MPIQPFSVQLVCGPADADKEDGYYKRNDLKMACRDLELMWKQNIVQVEKSLS